MTGTETPRVPFAIGDDRCRLLGPHTVASTWARSGVLWRSVPALANGRNHPMDMPHAESTDHAAMRILDAGETVHVQAGAVDAMLLVTDRRVAIAAEDR